MNLDLYDLPSFFRLAKLAKEHSNHRYQVGSVIVKRRPVSVGFNKIRTHPIYSDNKRYFSLHSEMDAVIHANIEAINGSFIYVFREDSSGKPAMARPCKNCVQFLAEYGIKKIYYTTSIFPYWKVEKL